MTYQDPNTPRPRLDDDLNRRMDQDEVSYAGWLLGGLAALALILGAFFMFGRDDGTTTSASNVNRPSVTQPSTNPPATTGQRSDPLMPTNPAGNVPTTTGAGNR